MKFLRQAIRKGWLGKSAPASSQPDIIGEQMQPITPQQPLYPTELRRRLETAERTLELQNAYIAQTQVLLDLTRRLA